MIDDKDSSLEPSPAKKPAKATKDKKFQDEIDSDVDEAPVTSDRNVAAWLKNREKDLPEAKRVIKIDWQLCSSINFTHYEIVFPQLLYMWLELYRQQHNYKFTCQSYTCI